MASIDSFAGWLAGWLTVLFDDAHASKTPMKSRIEKRAYVRPAFMFTFILHRLFVASLASPRLHAPDPNVDADAKKTDNIRRRRY